MFSDEMVEKLSNGLSDQKGSFRWHAITVQAIRWALERVFSSPILKTVICRHISRLCRRYNDVAYGNVIIVMLIVMMRRCCVPSR